MISSLYTPSAVRPRARRVFPRNAHESGALRDGLQGWREKVQDGDNANAEAAPSGARTPVAGTGEAGQGVPQFRRPDLPDGGGGGGRG